MMFNIGDKVTPRPDHIGYENATVINIFTQKKGKNKGKQYYVLKIMNGTATIPISAEVNYKLVK